MSLPDHRASTQSQLTSAHLTTSTATPAFPPTPPASHPRSSAGGHPGDALRLPSETTHRYYIIFHFHSTWSTASSYKRKFGDIIIDFFFKAFTEHN